MCLSLIFYAYCFEFVPYELYLSKPVSFVFNRLVEQLFMWIGTMLQYKSPYWHMRGAICKPLELYE